MADFSNFSLSDWLFYLENRHKKEVELGLDRIGQAAKKLHVLDVSPAKIITVAGTNGKGSTVCTLEKLYIAAGYQVGTYTSPHLIYFNERIRINGTHISDESLCQAFQWIEERVNSGLKYFEVVTLAALWY